MRRDGDCLDVLPFAPAASVDMVLADPPYGTTACPWDSVIPLEPMWRELKRVIKPRGAIVMTASQPFTTTLIGSNREWFKYCWVWNKGVGVNFLHAKRQPLKTTEDVCVFMEDCGTYNPQMARRAKAIRKSNNNVGESSGYSVDSNDTRYVGKVYNEAYPQSILDFSSRSDARGLHPTQKPVALMRYLIRTYTNEDDTVLDFCCGSGTTGVACQVEGRRFIGIERDEAYFAIAEKRVHASSAEVAVPLFHAPRQRTIEDLLPE